MSNDGTCVLAIQARNRLCPRDKGGRVICAQALVEQPAQARHPDAQTASKNRLPKKTQEQECELRPKSV